MGFTVEHNPLRRKAPRVEPTLDTLGDVTEESAFWQDDDITLDADERRFLHRTTEGFLQAPVSREHDLLIGHSITLRDHRTYTIEHPLAKGGQGVTYIAKTAEDSKALLKISEPFNRNGMHYVRKDPDPSERARAGAARRPIVEISILHELSKLGDQNPGPQLYDAMFVPHPERPDCRVAVIAMEYIKGDSLAQAIEEHNLTQEEKLDVIEQIGEALAVIHKHGIVHGDIKPGNLVVQRTASGITIKLVDFGSAVLKPRRERQLGPAPEHFPETESKRANYAIAATNPYSPAYASNSEVATMARDAFSYGRTIQNILYGEDFLDFEKMAEHYSKLPPELKPVSKLADQLVRNEQKRLSVEQAVQRIHDLQQPLVEAK